MSREEYVVFDLDGTLADITHRLHYIESDPKDWFGFFTACDLDAPIKPFIRLAMKLADHYTIEIWTGRSEEARLKTENWLERHHLSWLSGKYLRMRRKGDHRPDVALKGAWLDALPITGRPFMAFEDRSSVVEMWRSRGIPCCQVARGDF